jgi:hypothetical protein
MMVELVFWNAFQTPMAVPSMASFPTSTGMAQRKVMALDERAKEESKIGARGWTFVNPMSTKTTMYSRPVQETVGELLL